MCSPEREDLVSNMLQLPIEVLHPQKYLQQYDFDPESHHESRPRGDVLRPKEYVIPCILVRLTLLNVLKAWHRIVGSLISRLGSQSWTSFNSIGKSTNAPQ